MIGAYPHNMNEGDVPVHIFKEEMEMQLINIEKIVQKRIKELWKEGKHFQDIDHVQLAYE